MAIRSALVMLSPLLRCTVSAADFTSLSILSKVLFSRSLFVMG